MIRNAETRWPPVGQFVSVDGARVHYVRAGSGPPLVLIHGASGNVRDWTFALLARLVERFDVIAFDRPGHGYSERIKGAHSPHVQAAHLRKAAAALGVARAVVVGHSYGGTIALTWACDAPETVDALGLICAPSHEWEGSAGRLYDLGDHPVIGPAFSYIYPRLATEGLVEDALTRIFAPNPVPEGYAEHIGPGLAVRYATVRANSADIARLKPYLIAQTPRYPNLPMPVLQIHGTDDTIVPLHIHSERLKAALPGSELLVWEGVGHMPHHARPDEALAALTSLAQTPVGI
ncbi:MAG: alpha/beta hydrolase [Pseudomonadota bacterium]